METMKDGLKIAIKLRNGLSPVASLNSRFNKEKGNIKEIAENK